MKEIKPGHYLNIPEMSVELNAQKPAESKTINLHLDGVDIRSDYYYFSNKTIVTMSQELSIKMEGSAMQSWLCNWGSQRMRFCVDLNPIYLR